MKYRELLQEFENMSSEDREVLASELIKEAGIASAAIAGIKGATTATGKKLGTKALAVGKNVTKANWMYGAGIMSVPTAGAALVGKGDKGLGHAMGQALIPGFDEGAAGLNEVATAYKKTRIATPMLTGISGRGVDELNKFASNLDIKQTIDNAAEDVEDVIENPSNNILPILGGAALAGGLGYGSYRGYNRIADLIGASKYKEVPLNAANRIIGSAAEATTKAVARGPISRIVARTANVAGRVSDTLSGKGGNKLRTDYSGFKEVNSKKDMLKSLALFVLPVAGVSVAEDLITDPIKEEVQGSDFYRKHFETSPIHKKASLSDIGHRLVAEDLVKNVGTTTAFLAPLAVAGYLTKRNLYGGFEPLAPADLKGERVIIDIPKEAADYVGTMIKLSTADFIGPKEPTPRTQVPKDKGILGSLKYWMDQKFQKGKGLWPYAAKIDDWMAATPAYEGRKGLAHFIAEELPKNSLRGASYIVPGVGAGVLFGVNIKRGFEPLNAGSNLPYQAPNTTRVVITEDSDKDEQK